MAISKQVLLCVVLLSTSFTLAQDSSQDSSKLSSSEGSFEINSSEVLIEEPTSTTTTIASTTTIDEAVTTSNVTLVCPEGESEIIDVTSCYILCTSQEIFYTSNGFKEPGFDCEIREYVEQTNKLLATYGGECDGKGHCIKVENSTTIASTSMANTTLEK